MGVSRSSAFHGPGWRPRRGSLADDVRTGALRGPFGVSADWEVLTDVGLHAPEPALVSGRDPDILQHLEPIDGNDLAADLLHLAAVYSSLGIRVHWLPAPDATRANPLAGANAMYARDLLWMTPEGAVIGRMASTIRAGEEQQALRMCAELGIPVVRSVGGEGLFEGADALWIRPDLVALGVGHRTNPAGADQVAAIAREVGADVIRISVPDRIQHLLGVVQVLDDGVLAARTSLISALDAAQLRDVAAVIDVPEWPEVTEEFAFNFVCTAPRMVVAVEGGRRLLDLLGEHDVSVAASVPISTLLRGAGGIGCATAVLARGIIQDQAKS